jgi:hypothetical protein
MNGPDADDIDPLKRFAIPTASTNGDRVSTPRSITGCSRFCPQTPIHLLEIGLVGGGASLAMWADSLAQGRIVGVRDRGEGGSISGRARPFSGAPRPTARFSPSSARSREGSIPSSIPASLVPRMADGGSYVIEDVQTCFWPFWPKLDGSAAPLMKLASLILGWLKQAEDQGRATERAIVGLRHPRSPACAPTKPACGRKGRPRTGDS